jgi:uncharacterized protein (TIGR02466 family)
MISRDFDNLFPTPVGTVSNTDITFCDKFSNLILDIMTYKDKEILDSTLEWCTNDNLHTNKNFEELVNYIEQESAIFFNNVLGIKKEDVKLSSMWSNVRKSNSKHHIHVHANSFFSGVIYLRTPKNPGDIIFSDPRAGASMFFADSKAGKPLSYRAWRYTPSAGLLLFFPSWLPHGTDSGIFDNDLRISLSFNYSLIRASNTTMTINLN